MSGNTTNPTLSGTAEKSTEIARRTGMLPALGKQGSPMLYEGTEFEDVEEWLDDFDALCDGYSVSDEDKCRIVTRYVSHSVRVSIKSMPGYDEKEWDTMRDEMIRSYQSTALRIMWTIDNLRDVAKTAADLPMIRPGDFEAYLREFRSISHYLKSKGKLSEDTLDRTFWAGFPEPIKDKMVGAMYRISPREKAFTDSSVPYTFATQLKAARMIFDASSFDARERFRITDREIQVERDLVYKVQDVQDGLRAKGHRLPQSEILDLRKEAEGRAARKELPVDNRVRGILKVPKNTTVDNELELITRKLNEMDINSVAYFASYTAAIREGYPIEMRVQRPTWGTDRIPHAQTYSNVAPPHLPPIRQRPGYTNNFEDRRCIWCHTPGHILRNCPFAAEQAARGIVKREGNSYVYPDGSKVQGAYGEKLATVAALKHHERTAAQTNHAGIYDDQEDGYLPEEKWYENTYPSEEYNQCSIEEYEPDEEYYDPEQEEHRIGVTSSYEDWEREEYDRSHAAYTPEKPMPKRSTGFVPLPRSGERGYRDKLTRFQEPKGLTTWPNNIRPGREWRNNDREPDTSYPRREPSTRPPDIKGFEDVPMPEHKEESRRKEKPSEEKPSAIKDQGSRFTRKTEYASEIDAYKVIDGVLSTKMPMNLSIKELLSLSPLASSMISAGTRVKMIPVNDKPGGAKVSHTEYFDEVETYHGAANDEDREGPPPGLRKSKRQTLILFPGTIGGNPVDFMIDTGSEIDVCPMSIFKRFNPPVPISTTERRWLKGMNGPMQRMRGQMKGVELNIGGLTLTTDIHLHDEGPRFVILGMPFLTKARFEHFWDRKGRGHVRLHSRGERIEIPHGSWIDESEDRTDVNHGEIRNRERKRERPPHLKDF